MTNHNTEMIHVASADANWRQGKPVEDPDKVKRWGLVVAKPSEYLVHVRHGRVLSRSSGQGASCFKLPWDAVAVIPTSLQRLQFQADQVTREKVGIEVVGLAVYRIADPLIAYRVLNFSFPERAQQKLTEALTAMFVGATRRLIANLSVEDCLQKRKHAIAGELLDEVRPVVGGEGRPDDTTDRGWGVVIDTIEVQEVRVLSESVFSAMQAPYRASIDRAAREAMSEAERDIAMRQAQFKRETDEAAIDAARAVRERKAQASEAGLSLDAREAIRKAELETERARAELAAEQSRQSARIDMDKELEQQRANAELARQELQTKVRLRKNALEASEAEQSIATCAAVARAAAAEAEVDKIRADARRALRADEVHVLLAEGRAKAEVTMLEADAQVRRAEADARVITAERLPDLAAAFGGKIANMQVSHFGVGEHAFSSITDALQAVLKLVNGNQESEREVRIPPTP